MYMKPWLSLLAVACTLLILAPSALMEADVFALPVEAAREEIAFTIGEEAPLLESQADGADEILDESGDDPEPSDGGEGETPELIDRVVTISLRPGIVFTKVYDKTHNVTPTLRSTDLSIDNVADEDIKNVRITRLTAAYDSPAVGSRTVTIGATISQTSQTYNYILDPSTITVPATITPKTLIITPRAGQSKFVGSSDPSVYKASVKGLYQGDQGAISGMLAREPGEAAGDYRITLGTVSCNDNYVLQLLEGYFTILSDDEIVRLPLDLQAIEEESLTQTGARAYVIPDGCASIGSRAFADCASLIRVDIPESVTSIADDAFEGCSGFGIYTGVDSEAIQTWAGEHGIPFYAQ